MSYPDLKKLNDDWVRDRDSIKFLRGLAASSNFPKLVKKWAAHPAIQGYAKDALRQAPPDALSAALNFMQGEGLIKAMVENVGGALGLPPAVLAAGQTKV